MESSETAKVAITFDHKIADELRTCANVFKDLLKDIKSRNLQYEDEVSPQKWTEEYERLRVWSANIGAHQRGTASLDFRLRDASHISDQIVSLLKSLLQSLHDARDYLHDTSQADHNVADGQGIDFSLEDENNDKTEYQELYEGTVICIDCLFEMSLAVRKPSKIDRLSGLHKQLQGSFQQDDLRRLRDMFPKADPRLHENLAAALTMRRGVLKYYDQRQQNYARGASLTFDDIASQVEPTKSMFAATEYITDKETNETKSIDARSNRSLSSLMDENRAFYIPIPKELSDRRAFPCPYCHYLLDTYDKRDFIRHVLDDITPYQCIYPNCLYNQELLSSRSAWLQHLQTAHSSDWQKQSTEPCFLCGQPFGDDETIEKHVSRHLEEVALDVIPVPDTEDTAEVELEKIDDIEEDVVASATKDHSESYLQLVTVRQMRDTFNTVFVPTFRRFIASPPSNKAERTQEGRRLLELIAGNVKNVTEAIDGHETEIEAMRTQFFKEALMFERDISAIMKADTAVAGITNASDLETEPAENSKESGSIVPDNVSDEENAVMVDPTGEELKEKEFYRRRGKTKMPKRLVHPEVLFELGYAYDEQDEKTIVVRQALGAGNIDEIIMKSKTHGGSKSWSQQNLPHAGPQSPEVGLHSLPSQTVEHPREKKTDEQLKQRILKNEDGKIMIEKTRKEDEESEFVQRLKARSLEAGYSQDQMDGMLAKKTPSNELDSDRPTYIRCNRKHLSPETLDFYNLPWEYDSRDESYIIIKQYIDQDLQEELFRHTANNKIDKSSREGVGVEPSEEVEYFSDSSGSSLHRFWT